MAHLKRRIRRGNRGSLIIDTLIGVFVFSLGAVAFFSLMPVLKRGETISRYESVAAQIAARMIEHVQTLRPSEVKADVLSQLNLIDDGQVASPYSFTNVPMDQASRYSPSQALPQGTGTLAVTTIEGSSVRVKVTITWVPANGKTSTLETGTILGGYR